MEKLSELKIKMSYRTGEDDIVKDFYVPCMKASTLYRRAVGYFTSHGLAMAANGVANLVNRNGKMQLVASPHLSPEDAETLQNAFVNPDSVLKGIVEKNFDLEDKLINDRLNALAWLAATEMLEIKLAIRTDDNGKFTNGIYHEKLGMFSDDSGSQVSFIGSSNETKGGLLENFESIEAFCSWHEGREKERVEGHLENFKALWEKDTAGLKVFEFSEVGKELLERYKNSPPPEFGESKIFPTGNGQKTEKEQKGSYAFPNGLPKGLRDYQEEAIDAWKKADYRGIFAMATGSGKTLTALSLATIFSKGKKPLVVIIVCPFLNLCYQWIEELSKFGVEPIPCFQTSASWRKKFQLGYQQIWSEISEVLTIVTTNSTYMSENFQNELKTKVNGLEHLLIADEVHNLGSENAKNCLHEEIKFRLGLSATPDREYDPVGTSAVLEYFGGICYEYTMKQAMKDGHLSPYDYNIILLNLNDQETQAYLELSLEISRKFQMNFADQGEIDDSLKILLIRRAKLIANAENKILALDNVLKNLTMPVKKAIFYCGEGGSQNEIGMTERQIDKVTSLIGTTHNCAIRKFTYEESIEDREEIIDNLKIGQLDGVVAMRCLDEGIDLPELNMGFFLASSSNPRQFIQRRGRLLRKAPGKEKAIIYDFMVEPPDFGGDLYENAYNMEREFLKRELKRIVEFCNLAKNGVSQLVKLQDLRKKYDLIAL